MPIGRTNVTQPYLINEISKLGGHLGTNMRAIYILPEGRYLRI